MTNQKHNEQKQPTANPALVRQSIHGPANNQIRIVSSFGQNAS